MFGNKNYIKTLYINRPLQTTLKPNFFLDFLFDSLPSDFQPTLLMIVDNDAPLDFA